MIYKWYCWPVIIMALMVSVACTSKVDILTEQVNREISATERKLQELKQALNAGHIYNANILREYANKLSDSAPEYQQLVNELAKNALPTGAMFLSLQQRLNDVKSNIGSDENKLTNSLEELIYVGEAAHVSTFNDALSDPVNVLSDLSKGSLPRVLAVDKKSEGRLNGGSEQGPGSQLVGNPQYGQWVTGNDGLSFWEWYGIFSLLDDIGDGFSGRKRRHYYSRWSSYRPYSYYHDYGRYRYTKPSRLTRQNQLQSRTERSFRQRGARFSSPYAKQRSGASKLAKTSQSRPSSGSFRKASTYRGSSSSSTRRSSSRTSRGPSRGK